MLHGSRCTIPERRAIADASTDHHRGSSGQNSRHAGTGLPRLPCRHSQFVVSKSMNHEYVLYVLRSHLPLADKVIAAAMAVIDIPDGAVCMRSQCLGQHSHPSRYAVTATRLTCRRDIIPADQRQSDYCRQQERSAVRRTWPRGRSSRMMSDLRHVRQQSASSLSFEMRQLDRCGRRYRLRAPGCGTSHAAATSEDRRRHRLLRRIARCLRICSALRRCGLFQLAAIGNTVHSYMQRARIIAPCCSGKCAVS